MARFTAEVDWALAEGEDFGGGRYGRGHAVRFDGGVSLKASASPHVVGKWADPEAADPEEMLVAALASCHMLSFLHVARLAGFTVAAYRDRAEGTMEAIAPAASGLARQAVTRVVLHPRIDWTGPAPDAERLAALHAEAHAVCFIANSVRTQVSVA